ncbi:MAG: peptidoglycan-binding protein, partial [Coriobacteriales bacterium]|nr:peptidoglycan-binding protein [Coriobacteriales bacterium]
MRTIKFKDKGKEVLDLQIRLKRLGYGLKADGLYLEDTKHAVQDFKAQHNLGENCDVDFKVWSALVDANFSLGERNLYLTIPHFHGADVAELQKALSFLGFFNDKTDGIFGAQTETALRKFQSDMHLISDGVCGLNTFEALESTRVRWQNAHSNEQNLDCQDDLERKKSLEFEVVDNISACVYGLDDFSFDIAQRIGNLSKARSLDTKIVCASSAQLTPASNAFLVGIGLDKSFDGENCISLNFDNFELFCNRLKFYLSMLEKQNKRIYISIDNKAF